MITVESWMGLWGTRGVDPGVEGGPLAEKDVGKSGGPSVLTVGMGVTSL